VLIVAILFVRRLDELQQVDHGFRDAEHVLVATVDLGLAGLRGDSVNRQTAERMLERLRTIPEARSISLATFVPLGFLGYSSMAVSVDGYVPQRGEDTTYFSNRVTEGYFETMGIPILRGRAIDAQDRGTDADRRVAVVNEAFAQRYWKTEDPIGRVVKANGKTVTVVGVARNGKYYFLEPLDNPSPPFIYVPFAQWPAGVVVVHARAAGDPLLLMSAIRREVAAANPELSVLSPTTLENYTAVPIMPIRLGAAILTLLGGAALLLAALGLYAVIGYAVTQRQREIGVRMALGATPRRVVIAFLKEAGRYAGFGAPAGLLLAGVVVSGIQGYAPYILPQLSGARPIAVALALSALTSVALLAALVPARRATRVDPTTALRAE
jgi:predicted permease